MDHAPMTGLTARRGDGTHAAFVKGLAGMWTTGHVREPWGQVHLGQPVASQEFAHGKLWTFGSAVATCETSGGRCRFVGRPFQADDRPVDTVAHTPDAAAFKTVLSALDGRFSAFCALPNGDAVVATDWLGLGPLFVAELRGSVYFASHLGLLVDLLEDLPSLDQVGVASILAGATLIAGRTPYLGVRRLMAGQMATIAASDSADSVRLSIEAYVDPLEILTTNAADGRDVDGQFDNLLQSAVRRERVDPAHAVLMLSGGRDSLALAYALKLAEHSHDLVPATTFGRPSCTDMRVAKRAASELGLHHRPIPYGHWTLHEEAPFVARLSGGASGLQAAHFVVPFRAVADRADVAMTGFLGDAITGAHLDRPPYNRLAMSRLRAWKTPLEGSYAEELGVVRAELEQTENGSRDLSPSQRSLFIDITLRQATWISQSFSLCGWFVDLSTPFVHRGLASFLFNLPDEQLAGQALYDRWLDRYARRLRRSPTVTTTLMNGAASLPLTVRRLVCRGLGLSSPTTTVDWSRMYRLSSDWIETSVREFHDDERLREVAESEWAALQQTRRIAQFSPLLLALGIMRARMDKRPPS